MTFFRRLSAIALLGLGLLQHAHALEGVQYRDGRYVAPLSAFKGDEQPIILRGAAPQQGLSIPIPYRLKIEEAQLDLDFTNSISLIDSSQLSVLLDEYPVAQLKYKAARPEAKARMRLPLKRLAPGYHQLRLAGAQHYTNECEDPSRAELWSRVDVQESRLSLTAELRELRPVLSMLPDLIDKKLWSYYRLTIATPAELDTKTTFSSGALAAQGAALLLDYAPMGVEHKGLVRLEGKAREQQRKRTALAGIDFSSLPQGDVFILGTRASLTPYLREDELSRLGGSYYAIFARPDDARHFVFLIAGEDEGRLEEAARGFAQGRMVMPYAERARLEELDIPPAEDWRARGLLLPGSERRHIFREFGFNSVTLQGMAAPSANLWFWTQPDPFAPLKDTIEVELDVSFAPGMNEDSVLNLLLNDRFEAGLPLRGGDGGRYDHVKLSVPYAHLKPGWNELRLVADMKPQFLGGKCQPIIDSHLQTTVFDSSRLYVKSRGDLITLPDLDLLQRTGLPLVQDPDGRGLRVVLTSANTGTMSASWTMLGKMAQLNKHALTAADYSLSGSDALLGDGKNVLLIGLDSTVPQPITERSPFPTLSNSEQAMTVGEELEVESSFSNAMAGMLPVSWREWFGVEQRERLVRLESRASIRADFRRESAMMLMRNPEDLEHSVVVVTSADSEKLARDVAALVQFEPWSRIAGDTVLWSADSLRPGLVRSARLTKPFDEESLGPWRGIGYYFTQHPWLFLILAVLGVVFLVFATHYGLVYLQRRREQQLSE
jgi:hypothetical protein